MVCFPIEYDHGLMDICNFIAKNTNCKYSYKFSYPSIRVESDKLLVIMGGGIMMITYKEINNTLTTTIDAFNKTRGDFERFFKLL